MFSLIAIGDPIIDTHIQIDDSCAECRVLENRNHLCFDYGSKIPIVDSFQSLGGNAPNVAVGAVKLGLAAAVVSTVGADMNGEMAVRELKNKGVDTSYVTADSQGKTRYSIVLNYKQERTILSYSDKKKYVWPQEMPATAWVYYTGMSAGFESIQEKLIAYLKKHPTTRLAVNPGSYMLKYALDALKEIVTHTDALIINLEEAQQILGTTLEHEKSITGIIHALIGLGPKEVALTDAGRGAWVGNLDEVWHLESFPVEVVAKTGAGDAFSAAYLAARHYDHDIVHALAWGVANSSGVIQEHGPHAGLLTKPEIKKMIARFATILPKKIF